MNTLQLPVELILFGDTYHSRKKNKLVQGRQDIEETGRLSG